MNNNFTLLDLEKIYHIEIDRVVEQIKKENAKKVVLQLPEGIKPWAIAITDFIQEKLVDVEVHIWMDDCFGACDIPKTEADLLIQLGHAPWDKSYDVTSIDSKSVGSKK